MRFFYLIILSPKKLHTIDNEIIVVGAGGWGTALAMLLGGKGYNVKLWTHEPNIRDEINNLHTNSPYLPGARLPESIKATIDSKDIENASLIVNTVPTQFIRSLYRDYNFPMEGKIIVNGSKGIERKTLFQVSEIFSHSCGVSADNYVVITGPSHAEEVARESPTTVVAASENIELAKKVQGIFMTPNFRVYTSDDVVGCEIGGSLKNVIAIAAGIIDGLGMGDNTKAALITRGLAELTRLGIAHGANPLTFSGLSGLGDLFVTCNSKHSRNRSVGEAIGKGKTINEITSETKTVAEGISTSESAYCLGKKHRVEMPITEEIYKILFEAKKPLDAIGDLMVRQSKREWWW